MLYLLTGDIQIGKTRWLERNIADLAREGVVCHGVLAPGIWVESNGEHADANGFEKLGIRNTLLPDGIEIEFAKRIDLALGEGVYRADSQAGKARLGWHIDDAAIERVNRHFAAIPARLMEDAGARSLLVVDELGRLELLRDAGLTEAMALLDKGPTGGMRDALIVVRETLVDIAEERYAGRWGGAHRIDMAGETLPGLLQA